VVRHLVQHYAPDLTSQPLRIAAVHAFQRPAEDRDLVGQRAGVERAARVSGTPWEAGGAMGRLFSTTTSTFDVASQALQGSASIATSRSVDRNHQQPFARRAPSNLLGGWAR
jgi:hypothetical protein